MDNGKKTRAGFLFTLLASTSAPALENGDFSDLTGRHTGSSHYTTSSNVGFMPAWVLLGANGGIVETVGVPAAVGESAFRFHTLTGNFGDNKLDQCIRIDPEENVVLSYQVRTNASPITNDLRIRLNPNFYTDMAACETDLQSDSTANRLNGALGNVDRDVRLGSVSGFAANQWFTIPSATHGTTGPMLYEPADIPAGATAMRLSLRARDDLASASRFIWFDDVRITQPGSATSLVRNGDFGHVDLWHSDMLAGTSGWFVDRDGSGTLRAAAGAVPFAVSGDNAFYFESLTGNFGVSRLDQCVVLSGTQTVRPALYAMSHSPHAALNVRVNVDFFASSDCSSGEVSALQLREDFQVNGAPGEWVRVLLGAARTPAELSGVSSALVSVRAHDRSNSANSGPDGFQRTLYVDAVSLDATVACDAPASIDTYELRAFLDPDVVLTGSQSLIHAVLSEFDVVSAPYRFNVQYLDSNALDLRNQGWSIRTRKREDQGAHRLQYKKRYAVTGGNLAAALQTARAQGFDACTALDVEVDWGYGDHQTLSFQVTENVSLPGYSGLALPDLEDTQAIAADHAIPELVDWTASGWGLTQIDLARLYGPVYFERYAGDFEGFELNIEVWHVLNETGDGMEYVVEASFRASDSAVAAEKLDDLIQLLDTKGWLLPQDILKTQIVMERY